MHQKLMCARHSDKGYSLPGIRVQYWILKVKTLSKTQTRKNRGYRGKTLSYRSCVYRNENTGQQYWTKMQNVEPVPRFAHQLVYDHIRKVNVYSWAINIHQDIYHICKVNVYSWVINIHQNLWTHPQGQCLFMSNQYSPRPMTAHLQG